MGCLVLGTTRRRPGARRIFLRLRVRFGHPGEHWDVTGESRGNRRSSRSDKLGKGELGELIDQGEGFQGQRHRLGGRGLGATQNRQIRVPNFWVAIDQGIAVQPDNIIAQTESSVVCGLGLSPKERISIKNGEARIELLRLHGYAQSRRSRDSCRGRRYDNHPTGVGLFARLHAPYNGGTDGERRPHKNSPAGSLRPRLQRVEARSASSR
jgi:hypothetical protein